MYTKILSYLAAILIIIINLDSICAQEPAQTTNLSEIPNIIQQSESYITVHQGDIIILQIEVSSDQNVLYRWIKNNQTLCTQNKCSIDTNGWAFGRHRVVAVAYNQYGSDSVEFLITVLSKSSDEPTRTHTPSLIEAQNKETISRNDFVAEGFKGIGYSYDTKKVQVLALLKRLLNWNETLKSHVKGIVRFGKLSSEEHFLMPESIVKLSIEDEGGRIINLIRGTLRSRNLKNPSNKWKVFVEDWMYIIPSKSTDIIVSRIQQENKDIISIVVLRGNITIIYKDSENKSVETKLDTQQFLKFIKDENNHISLDEEISESDYVHIENVIIRTSPQYFINNIISTKQIKFGEYLSITKIKPQEIFDMSPVLEGVNEYNFKKEYWIILEKLLPHAQIGQNQFAYNMVIAQTYKNLFLFSEAEKYLNFAIKIEADNPQPYFDIAMIKCTLKKWSECEIWLNKASNKQYPQTAKLHYFKGLAAYNQNKFYSAQNNFITCLWFAEDYATKQLCENYLYIVKERRPFGARVSLGVFIDSNIFRLPKGKTLSEDFKNYGRGYLFLGQIAYNPYYTPKAHLGFAFDLSKKSYFTSGLEKVEILYEELSIDWNMSLFSVNQKKYLNIRAKPYLGLFFVGDNRSDDALGIDLNFEFTSLKTSPTLLLHYSSHLDPIPGRDDIIDVDTYEVLSKVSDRSFDLTSYGILFYLYNNNKNYINLQAKFKSKLHKKEETQADDYQQILIKIQPNFMLYTQLMLQGELSYSLTNYKGSTIINSTTKRKDQTLGIESDVIYFWRPSLSNELNMQYTIQNSNITDRRYNRYWINLSMTYYL